MEITYLDCDGKGKLFSFHRHDYRTLTIDEEFYQFDGGITVDPDSYCRMSAGTLQRDDVKELIEDIREQFEWTKNYDKDNVRLEKSKKALLKDLTTSHIYGILSYFNNRAFKKFAINEQLPVTDKAYHIIQEIFIQELEHRLKL